MKFSIRKSAVIFSVAIGFVLILYGSVTGWSVARAGFAEAALPPDELVFIRGFTVELQAGFAGSVVDPNWESLEGGALGIEFGDSSVGSDQFHTTTPGHKYVSEVTLSGPLPTGGSGVGTALHDNGAGKFRLEIDDLPTFSANVDSIEIGPLTIDLRDLTTGADFDYRVYGPGDSHLGALVISSRRGSGSSVSEAYQWWLATSQGQQPLKSVSIIALTRDGTDGRRWNFFDCVPVLFHPFGRFSPDPSVATEVLNIGCNRVELAGPGRQAMAAWINGTTEGLPWERNVTVTEISNDGTALATYTYVDAFPVRYVFPSFSSSGTGFLYEELTFKPIRLDFN